MLVNLLAKRLTLQSMPHANPDAKRAYTRKYLRERYANDRKYREKKNAQRRVLGRCQWQALALLREINDALVLPSALQERVDAILDSSDGGLEHNK